MAKLALKCLGKAKTPRLGFFITRNCFKNNLSRLAEAYLRGIDDPGPVLRGDDQAIDQRIDPLAEVEVEKGFGGREFHDFPVLVEAVESAGAQFGEPFFERVVRKGG